MDYDLGEPFPPCLKTILYACGYDNISNISLLDEKKIFEIEEYICKFGRNTIDQLVCCYSEQYKNQSTFKFLPGHNTELLRLPIHAKNVQQSCVNNKNKSNVEFSTVLTELIKSAENIVDKEKNHANYSEIVRHFFTYIFLLSGKCAYETLRGNLPIPSVKTIRKLKIFFLPVLM